MKNKMLLIIIVASLFLSACGNKKNQNFFRGTIVEITDSYFLVKPDDEEIVKETYDIIQVSKETIRQQDIDFLSQERVQVVYNEILDSTDRGIIDIVYAIYRESELS